jgi:hypothetical protein
MTVLIDDGPCTITGPEGQTFTAGGAWLTDDAGVLYVADVSGIGPKSVLASRGELQTWHGQTVGTYYVTGRWDRWTKYDRIRMAAIRATIDGKEYHGRFGYDWNQSVFLRRCKER